MVLWAYDECKAIIPLWPVLFSQNRNRAFLRAVDKVANYLPQSIVYLIKKIFFTKT